MRPLSAVPTRTLRPCGAGATAKAVIAGELHSTSVPPSGRMRKTALRAFDRSLRLRPAGDEEPPMPPLSSGGMVTGTLRCPPDESDCGDGAGAFAERCPLAASLKASA